MEFKIDALSGRILGVWAEGIAYRYVERAARAPMNAGETGPHALTGREICQPIPDNHVFYAALSCQWAPTTRAQWSETGMPFAGKRTTYS
jgi:hypothetical protein